MATLAKEDREDLEDWREEMPLRLDRGERSS